MTHAEKVLQLLSDGEPHGHMEGYRLGVMLHSRVADLRKQGHTIKCWRDGDNYLYQLFGTVRAGDVAGSGGDPSGIPPHGPSLHAGGPRTAPGTSTNLPFPEACPVQLSVWEAAA